MGNEYKDEEHSEKMAVLINLIKETKQANDKIVIVSNFTSILDSVEAILKARNYSFYRLDGSTNGAMRSKLVTEFNSKYNKECFIFLLSSKAGGCGLNLIGANRLILMEPDWNPATDHQAMARIWRDGQKKKCKVYRLITIGSIEEKILQRQIRKNEVADPVCSKNKKTKRHFDKNQLKEIFALKLNLEKCETIDIMKGTMNDWRICCKSQLIQTIITTDHDKQIPVIFQRSIDPKTDPISKWGIKQKVIYDDDYKQNEKNDDSENIEEYEEYHDSDMDSEHEYVLKETNYDDEEEEEDKKDKESEQEQDSDLEVIAKNNDEENRFFDDEDDDAPQRTLKHKEKEQNEEEQDSAKQIKSITQQTRGSIDDLNVDTNFSFDDCSF